MRKISIISDVQFAGKENEQKEVLAQFSFIKELGGEVQLVTDNFFNQLPVGSKYKSAKHRIEFEGPANFDYDPKFLQKIQDSEVVIAHYSAVNKKMMDAIPNLKMIGILRSGFENVELDAANGKNIIVCNSPGRVSEPVADYTVAMILAFNRNISKHDMTHSKQYIRDVSQVPPLMKEMTIGIVGFGIIGSKVAQRLLGFGCKIIAYDPFMNEEKAIEMSIEAVSLNELMQRSDCVTVHARFTEETENLIGAEQIALMKETAFIVNTSRSRLIEEEAMIIALKEKKIRGAALDVYNEEPLPEDSKFYELDNVLLSPHIAGTAGDWTHLTISTMKEEVSNYLSGRELCNQVNRK